MEKLQKLLLKNFNSCLVESDYIDESAYKNMLDKTIKHGFVFSPKVASLKDIEAIYDYLVATKLDSISLNKSFHKSWSTIKESSREELAAHQCLHYLTTYGFEKLGLFSEKTIYIPSEELDIPDLEDKVSLTNILALTKDEVSDKILSMLRSGVALKEQTIDELLEIMNLINFEYTSDVLDSIKNKEAIIKIADSKNIFPSSPSEFVRYLIYKATGNTLVIKSPSVISSIKTSNIDITDYVKSFGKERLSEVFHRYKPIFLAFKKANSKNKSVVNKLRKLAKKYHIPMRKDILNLVTSSVIDEDSLIEALDNVNNFRKIRLLYALQDRMTTNSRLYRIRNGKAYVTESETDIDYTKTYNLIYKHLVDSLDVKGKNILVDKNIDYSIPSSEKMFVGNIPEGTSVETSKNALFGIYWENSWGANDLDLSAISIGNKVGWDSCYNDGTVMFSGDITNAHNGASEYNLFTKNITEPYIIKNNVFSGNENCKFKVIIGTHLDDNVQKNFMIDPNNVLIESELESTGKDMNLGIVFSTKKGVKLVISNFSTGNCNISSDNDVSNITRDFIVNRAKNPISLGKLLKKAGANIIYKHKKDTEVVDLRINNLQKDTILDLLV